MTHFYLYVFCLKDAQSALTFQKQKIIISFLNYVNLNRNNKYPNIVFHYESIYYIFTDVTFQKKTATAISVSIRYAENVTTFFNKDKTQYLAWKENKTNKSG